MKSDVPRDASASLAVGDLDLDGDTDIVLRYPTGGLVVLRNDGGNRNRSLRVRLTARVSNRSALGSKVEIRAGSLRQKLELSAASPAVAPADLIVGLGARKDADVVRVLWPAGILQAEIPQTPSENALTVHELDRKPSSCPYLYTWNGERFEFVTDFLGGGELGYFVAPGVRNRPDPDEYVRIDGRQLKERDGRYELRVTNELEEALFLDRARLIAIDHPADVEVHPEEGLKATPPRFRLHTIHDAAPPLAAIDDHGHDVLDRVARLDRRYSDDFALERIRGYAAPHHLTLTLPETAAKRRVLLLTGWTDYAFSSDNFAASQAGVRLIPPSLEVKDGQGRWRTAIADVGVPVGRPQTVVVDLSDAVPPSVREVRISTTMRIYWDQIRVGSSVHLEHQEHPHPGHQGHRGHPVHLELEPVRAHLRWRGFSAESTPDEPYRYDYTRVSPVSPWKLMPGRYTREGDVRPLLTAVDDMFVVARPGDEIALSFDASSVTPDTTRLDANVSFLRGRLQQGDEPPLVESGRGRAAPLPRHARLSVRSAARLSARRRASRVPRALQHTDRRPHAAAAYRGDAMTHIRYAAAACQTDLVNPTDRGGMRANTDRMLEMIDAAVAGSAPFLPVRLVVFPEFAHAAPVYPTVAELAERLAVPIPNDHTDRLERRARALDIYIQSGSFIETDPRWPGVVFNTTCLIGPEGILYKYRKVNPWIPYEVHASPHDIEGYDDPLFPVADTPIGRIGCAICYDWLFPEAIRQLAANGAEVLVRVSAYMDPWGATEPMNWWTLVNRCRAIENAAFVVAANQGASLRHYPPYSWPGGSQIVDFDGRMIAEASPGPASGSSSDRST